MVEPFPVNELVPEEADIKWAMNRLSYNGSGSPYGMQAEHLRRWLAEVQDEENPDATNWMKLVDMVQTEFHGSRLTEEATWKIFVLLTKGGRYFHGIGLVEVIWKTIAVILDRCLGIARKFYDVIHRFWPGRRMGNGFLNAKLLKHLVEIREKLLYEILLDLHKAYNDMDREICLDIFEGYIIGPQALRLLRRYWGFLVMVTKVIGYYGSNFKGYWGVT